MTFLKNASKSYCLVYNAKEENAREIATKLAEQIQSVCGLKLKACPQKGTAKNAILLGTAAFDVLPNGIKISGDESVYISCAVDNNYFICSNDRFGMAVAAQKLIELLSVQSNTVEIDTEEPSCSKVSDLAKDCFYKDAVVLARKLYGTYGSWLQKKMTEMNDDDRADMALVKALIARMGDHTLVLSVGSSSALYQGFVRKLSSVDYQKVTKLSAENHVMIAAEFTDKYFEGKFLADADGYVDLTSICNHTKSHCIYLDVAEGIAIVTPKDATSYDDPLEFVNGYTNAQYVARMKAFFNNPVLPEPSSNVEQTRNVVMASQFGTEYVFDYTEHTYDNYYSPAIWSVTETDGSKTLYISHEISKLRNHVEVATCTLLKKSVDDGKTWETVGCADSMRWASLFALNGKLYLEGNRTGKGNVQIAAYDPANGSFECVDLDLQVMGSAPCAVAVANGRVYLAHNGAVISANVNDDLFKNESWTVSNNPNDLVSREDYEKLSGKVTDPTKRFWFEEGNVVEGPTGELYAVYRIDATPTWGHAAIFRLSKDGKTLSLIESCGSIIDFPSNQSKFMIKRDPKTGMYVTFTSLPTADFTHQRNVLGLVVSDDLFHWKVIDVLLVDRQMMNTQLSVYSHAFQYVDFVFDGDDILFIVRESAGDTCTYHDGTFVTIYTIYDYVDFIARRK